MKGFRGFESWDETYVHHLHNEKNRTVLEYRDTVHGHYIASISTAEVAANNREGILRDFYGYGVAGVEEGATEDIREILIPPGTDLDRFRIGDRLRILVNHSCLTAAMHEQIAGPLAWMADSAEQIQLAEATPAQLPQAPWVA